MLAMTGSAAGIGEAAVLCEGGVAAPGADASGALGEGAAAADDGGCRLRIGRDKRGGWSLCCRYVLGGDGNRNKLRKHQGKPPAAMTETNDRPYMCVSPRTPEVSPRRSETPLQLPGGRASYSQCLSRT